VVSLRIRIVCNLLAKELLKYLISKRTEVDCSKVAQWFKENRDLSRLIPLNLNIPPKYKTMIIKGALKEITENPKVAHATYDLILQNVHDIAALARQDLNTIGDKEGAENMRRVQVITAFLGSDKVRPWYYKNMERALRKIGDQLAGPGSSSEEENENKTERTILEADRISDNTSCV